MKLQSNVDLSARCTLGLPFKAQYFSRFSNASELLELHEFALTAGHPLHVLGGGSNVLPKPALQGLVIQSEMNQFQLLSENDDSVLMAVDAGAIWHDWVQQSIRFGHGLENLALIPGSVGAAPVQNIGAYGVEVAQLIEFVDIYQFSTRQFRRMGNAECRFGYRDSVFKRELKGDCLIVRVAFRLQKQFVPRLQYGPLKHLAGNKDLQPQLLIDAVSDIRRSKLPDPLDVPNVGSFFKNPVVSNDVYTVISSRFDNVPAYPVDDPGQVKLAAGWLVEKAGWKGRRHGHVGMHGQQALVLVAQDGVTLQEVLDVSALVAGDVERMFGVRLEREPGVFG